MKKIFILISLIISSATSFSQGKDSSTRFTKKDYLQKSKNQKTAAWLLTGGAVAMSIGALVHDMNNVFTDASGSTDLYIVSAAMLTGGITMFIASSKNKKKANAISLLVNIEDVQICDYTVVRHHPLPSLGVSVGF